MTRTPLTRTQIWIMAICWAIAGFLLGYKVGYHRGMIDLFNAIKEALR